MEIKKVLNKYQIDIGWLAKHAKNEQKTQMRHLNAKVTLPSGEFSLKNSFLNL